MHRAVYRIAGSPRTWLQQAMAACLAAGPKAVASHRTAAAIWSLPEIERVLEVSVPEPVRVSPAGIRVHRTSHLPVRHVRRLEGIPTTTAARTLIDLSGVLDRSVLDRVLDHALATRLVTHSRLSRELQFLGRQGRRGTRALATALAARPSTLRVPGSALEFRIVRLLRRHRLPAPVCQHPVKLAKGRAYLDLAYPDAMLAIEADSYRHHSSLSDWSRDRTRNNELIAMGWRILPVTFADVATRPAAVADQIRRALSLIEARRI